MTEQETITALQHVRQQIDIAAKSLDWVLEQFGMPGQKNTTCIPKKLVAFVTKGQLGMFFAIRKKHGIPDELMAQALQQFGVNQEADIPLSQAQQYRESLINLAMGVNPHFPIEHFLSDGSVNPEWMAAEAQ